MSSPDVERIVFPDAVAAIIGFLYDNGAVEVVGRVPNPRPAKLIRVSLAGGSRLDIARRSVRLLVEAWAPTEPEASKLAELASAQIEAATRSRYPVRPGVWITASPEDFSVPVNFPDPLTASPRYQFYCTLIQSGSAV